MTTSGRRKLFRRKFWFVVTDNPDDHPEVCFSRSGACETRNGMREYDQSARVIPVLVTEIRAGGGGKRK